MCRWPKISVVARNLLGSEINRADREKYRTWYSRLFNILTNKIPIVCVRDNPHQWRILNLRREMERNAMIDDTSLNYYFSFRLKIYIYIFALNRRLPISSIILTVASLFCSTYSKVNDLSNGERRKFLQEMSIYSSISINFYHLGPRAILHSFGSVNGCKSRTNAKNWQGMERRGEVISSAIVENFIMILDKATGIKTERSKNDPALRSSCTCSRWRQPISIICNAPSSWYVHTCARCSFH